MTFRLLTAIAFLVLALACAGFVRLNVAPVAIDLYVARATAGTGAALLAACIVGWCVGVAGALAWVRRLVREKSALAMALRLAEGELRTLRATQPGHAR
jgi:hypothetical protein